MGLDAVLPPHSCSRPSVLRVESHLPPLSSPRLPVSRVFQLAPPILQFILYRGRRQTPPPSHLVRGRNAMCFEFVCDVPRPLEFLDLRACSDGSMAITRYSDSFCKALYVSVPPITRCGLPQPELVFPNQTRLSLQMYRTGLRDPSHDGDPRVRIIVTLFRLQTSHSY